MIWVLIISQTLSDPLIDISSDGLELYFTGDGIISQSIARKKGNYLKIKKVTIDGPSTLNSNSFESFSAMSTIFISDTVTEISSECFKGCSALLEFAFPSLITSIKSGLFWDCTSLKKVYINASVNSINTYTLFMACRSLEKFEVSLGNQFLTTDDSHSFLLSKNGTVLYSAPATKVQIIPTTVKQIYSNCYYSQVITTIDFSQSKLEIVSDYGFRQLTISSLEFPSTLLSVHYRSFFQSSIQSLSFPSSLTYFDPKALEGIVVLNNMTAEDSAALKSENGIIMDGEKKLIFFVDPTIDTIIIGPTIEQIETSRVLMSHVINVTVLPGNRNLSSFDCVLYNADGSQLLASPGGKENVTVYSKCQKIQTESFFRSKVKNVTLNEGLEYIEFRAFGSCTLSSINLPSTLKYLRGYSFAYCYDLKIDIVLGPNILSIKENCFDNCGVTSINMSQCTHVTFFIGYTFRNCKMTSIILPPNLNSLSKSELQGSLIQSITIPGSVENISTLCFKGCTKLSTVTFDNCSLLSVIPESCFENSGITSITIPKSVTSLKVNSFRGCTKLTKINFEEGSLLNEILSGVIDGCSALEFFEIPDRVNSISEGAFSNANGLLNFKTNSNPIFEAKNGILLTNSASELFAFPAGRESVVIADYIKSITKLAFSHCTNLKNVIFGESSTIKSIPENTFLGCTSLTSITLPSALVDLDPSAFAECNLLSSVLFAGMSNLETIQENTFKDCTQLKSFGFSMVPKLKTIGDSAFEGCSKLKTVSFYQIEHIGSKAFFGCSSVSSISISDSLKYLGSNAFGSCTVLSSFRYCGESTFDGVLFEKTNSLSFVSVKYDYAKETFGGLKVFRCLDSDCQTPTTLFSLESSDSGSNALIIAAVSLSD